MRELSSYYVRTDDSTGQLLLYWWDHDVVEVAEQDLELLGRDGMVPHVGVHGWRKQKRLGRDPGSCDAGLWMSRVRLRSIDVLVVNSPVHRKYYQKVVGQSIGDLGHRIGG